MARLSHEPTQFGVVTPFGNERDSVDAFMQEVLQYLTPKDRECPLPGGEAEMLPVPRLIGR